MERISVYGLVGRLAVSDSDGEILNAEIEKFLSKGKVIVDFSGVEVVLTHFLDAAIGVLYRNHLSSELKSNLVIIGLKSTDALYRVTRKAKQFYTREGGCTALGSD